MGEKLHPELERRLTLLEDPLNQGRDFDGLAYLVLIGLGVLVPVVAIFIGG